jgi:hypothetical protein
MLRWFWLAVWLVVLLGLTLGIMRFFFTPKGTELIVAVVTADVPPFPPNAWAREDAERLVETWSGGENRSLRVDPVPLQGTWDALFERLQAARPGGPDQNAVLIYLSGHTLPLRQGNSPQPCLVVGAGSDNGHFEVRPLTTLFERIGQWITDQGVGKQVVLLLDTGRGPLPWSFGSPAETVADQIQALAPSFPPGLSVIGAAGSSQVAWAFPERGGSAFGFAVCEGLTGPANADGDDRITLLELFDYVRQRTNSLAIEHRLARQEPFLVRSGEVPEDADFAVAYVPAAGEGRRVAELPHDAGRWIAAQKLAWTEKLHTLWHDHEDLYPWHLAADGSIESRPASRRLLAFTALEHGLLRLEQLSDAGTAFARQAGELERELTGLVRQLRAEAAEKRPAHSIARSWKPQSEGVGETLIERVEAVLQKPDAPPLTDVPYRERAWGIWNWALRAAENGRDLPIDDLLQHMGTRADGPEFVEIRLLRFLREGGHLPESARQDKGLLGNLLLCEGLCERAAALASEPSTLDVVRPLVDVADRLRRRAIDNAFAGVNRAEDVQAALAACQEALALEEEVHRAISLSKWARWNSVNLARLAIVRASMDASPAAALDAAFARCAELGQLCEQVAVRLDELRRRAAAFSPDANALLSARESFLESISESRTQLDDSVVALERVFAGLRDDVLAELKQRAKDAKRDRQYAALLATPTVTGAARQQLRQDCLNHRQRLAETPLTPGSPPNEPLEKSDTTAIPSSVEVLNVPPPGLRFFLASLLRQEAVPRAESPRANSPMPWEPLALDGQIVDIPFSSYLSSLYEAHNTKLREAPAGAGHEVWIDHWGQFARRQQAVAPLVSFANLGDPERPWGDASRELAGLHECRQFLWLADRVLEDFFGNDGAEGADVEYFAEVAELYLEPLQDAVRTRAYRDGLDGQLEDIVRKHEARKSAAAFWLQATVGGQELLDTPQTLTREAEFAFQDALPSGAAAVRILVEQGGDPKQIDFTLTDNGPRSQFHAVSVPGQHAYPGLALILPFAASSPAGEAWRLEAFFRGHHRSTQFDVEILTAAQVARWQVPRFEPARFTIHPHAPHDGGAIAIILDCSESMGSNNFLKPARTALQRMLPVLLTDDQDYDVSLWLFGHRRDLGGAWNPRAKQWQGGRLSPALADVLITQDNDVQLIWESEQQPRPVLFNEILPEESGVVAARGQTPLHLAMHQAVERSLADVTQDIPRRLLVITDGADGVGPANRLRVSLPIEHLAATLSAANQENPERPVQVTLICSNVLQGAGNIQDLVDELNRRVGVGTAESLYLDFRDAEVLRKRLKLAAGQFEFGVRDELTGHALNSTPIQQDEPFALARPDRYAIEGEDFDGRVLRAVVAAEGGEFFQLIVKDVQDGRPKELIHLPYERTTSHESSDNRSGLQNPIPAEVAHDPFHPEAFHVVAHTPEPVVSGMTFPVSIQNANSEGFSPRPKEIWAEITPLGTRRGSPQPLTDQPYVFYDRAFEPNTPVPVLSLVANAWPDEADLARVELWFNIEPQAGLKVEKPLREALGAGETNRLTIEGREVGYTVSVESAGGGSRVVVVEKHPVEQGGPLAGLLVRLSREEYEVIRSYFPTSGRVRHEFRFTAVSEQEILNSCQLRITAAEEIKRKSVHVTPPLNVRIPTSF